MPRRRRRNSHRDVIRTVDSEPVRVRLDSPAQVVAGLPYLLGFHPSESLVVIGVHGRPRTVCLTIRADLSEPPENRPALADYLLAHLARAGAAQLVLVLVSDRLGADEQAALVAVVRAAAKRKHVEVADVLWLRSGRWGSLHCTDPACCPPEGTPVDRAQAADLAAACVLLGDVVHESRDALEVTLRSVGGVERAALDSTFEWVSRQLLTELTERGWEAVAEDSIGLLAAAVADRVEGGTPLEAAEVARLALGLADARVRDRVLTWADGELAAAAESLWVELVRRATPPYDAAPATVLAVHAYLRGNGAYARIALDRALASDPDYSLAGLLARGLDRGVPPRVVRQAFLERPAA